MTGRALALVVVFACGDNRTNVQPDATPDASIEVPAFAPECHEVPVTSPDPFATAAELGPVVPGTLAGWDPDGRWFLTGVRVGGQSSYHFARQGAQVIVDRDTQSPGTIDDDVLFQRGTFLYQGQRYVIAKRVSNRAPDGSLRAERALCDEQVCRVCTAKMIRATRNDGEGESMKLSLVGELFGASWAPGFTFNVRVLGTTAYLVRIDGLYIIDVADPAHPTQVGYYHKPQLSYSNDVKVFETGGKRYAVIADAPVDVVDVTNPAAPQLVATIAEEAHTLAIESRGGKTYAYFGNYDASTPIYDITNPTQPVEVGSYQTSGQFVHDLSVESGIAYLNAWDAGLLAVDFTTPSAPVLLGAWAPTTATSSHSNWTTTVAGRHIALHGDENYGAHLDIVDVDPSSATFMKPFASYKTRDFISIHNIMAFGSKAYFTYYQDGVRVVDLSNPAAPALLGYFNTWDPQAAYTSSAFFEGAVGIDVDLTRKLVFVADSPRGLLILRDDTP